MKNLLINTNHNFNINNIDFEVVERKGIGHPDTLCDTLAEKISQAYSQYCINRYGVILRHMLDKIALSGGTSMVKFGGGEMKKPIKLYLNCRFTKVYEGENIPYLQIVENVVKKHFQEVLPLLNVEKWLIIVDNTHISPGPGIVYEEDGTSKNERRYFFEVPKEKFASFHNNGKKSNDTSTAVAYSPLSNLEKIVLLIENNLNSSIFKKEYPFIGTDIKIMAKRIKNDIGITACIPFISKYTPSEEFYYKKIQDIKKIVCGWVKDEFNNYSVSMDVNTRDQPEKSDYYLTLTGSAIESGDEGVVGRGNRYNGLIPFTRHMSMEACCGKNPVYHIGKIYTALGSIISNKIFNKFGFENYVYIVSQMGRDLSDPWFACIDIYDKNISKEQVTSIETMVEKEFKNIDSITIQIIKGEINLY